MGNFATQKMNAERVVVLAKESEYARGIQEIFRREFERHGGEVVETIEFPSLSSDLSGVIERVMTLQPDAVYLAAYAEDLAQMIAHLRDQGYTETIFTTSAFAAPEIIAQVGRPAEGVFLTQAAFDLDSEEPETQAFVQGYRAKFGSDPNLYAVHGYDAMMALAEALRRSGALPSDFWSAVRSLRDFTGAAGAIQFDERGDVEVPASLCRKQWRADRLRGGGGASPKGVARSPATAGGRPAANSRRNGWLIPVTERLVKRQTFEQPWKECSCRPC